MKKWILINRGALIYNITLYIKPTHYTVVYSNWILHKIVIYQYTVIDHYTAISKIRYSIFKSHLLEWSAALSSKGNQGLLEKWLQCYVREKRKVIWAQNILWIQQVQKYFKMMVTWKEHKIQLEQAPTRQSQIKNTSSQII